MQAKAAFSKEEVREAWIEATRLRTLPLAASGSFVAAGIAITQGCFRFSVFLLMLLVSLMLQVISNFADDYGDLSHGLDDETRVGPKRGMQRGVITPAQMRKALIGLCAATFAAGCLLIFVAFTGGPAISGGAFRSMVAFLLLGVAAIAAAVFYTVGPHPYGYLGLGDIMSFIFFGLVAVVAGSFLYTHAFSMASLVAGLALGLPVAAVMNINNMRDSLADAAKNKLTIANRLYALGCSTTPAKLSSAAASGPSHHKPNSSLSERSNNTPGSSPNSTSDNTPSSEPGSIASSHPGGIPSSVSNSGPSSTSASASSNALSNKNSRTSGDRQGSIPSVARATIQRGETFMRTYHVCIVYLAIALFVVCTVMLRGLNLGTIARIAVVAAAAYPLSKATQAVYHELDHTKLDRFMAPTSLGTVTLSLGFTLAIALF